MVGDGNPRKGEKILSFFVGIRTHVFCCVSSDRLTTHAKFALRWFVLNVTGSDS